MVDIVSTVNQPQFHYINPSNDAFIQDYGSLIQTIDKNNLMASQQYTKIDQMLAQMDVNDADKWIIDESKKRLNKVVQDGSNLVGMGTSINDLIRYEGDMLVDPLLKQAVINQQKWRTEEAAVNARQDLPENMKEWYLNKYNYKGINVEQDAIVDDNGETIGYKEWSQPFKLAEHVQDITILEQVKARLNYDSFANGKTTSQYDIDENGKLVVTNTNTKSEERQYIDKEKVWNAVLSTVMGDIKNRLSYYQEYLYDMNRDFDNKDINSSDGFNTNDGSLGLDFQTWLYRKFLGNTDAIAYERYKKIESEQDKITKLGTNSGNGGGTSSVSTVLEVRSGAAGVVTSDNAITIQSSTTDYTDDQVDLIRTMYEQNAQKIDSTTTINQ